MVPETHDPPADGNSRIASEKIPTVPPDEVERVDCGCNSKHQFVQPARERANCHFCQCMSPLPYLILHPERAFLGGVMESAFALWVGRPVVLRVALGDCKVGVRGTLLKDGTETLKMRVAEGFDIDIYKEMVLAIEEERPHLFLLS